MRKTLAQVVAAAVASESDRSEQHLAPANDRVGFTDDTVEAHSPRTDSLFVYMELEVDAKSELQEDGGEHDIGEEAVDAREEGSAAVRMTEDVPS